MLKDIEKDLNIKIAELRPDEVMALPKEAEVTPAPPKPQ
jgi:hypothetical protein